MGVDEGEGADVLAMVGTRGERSMSHGGTKGRASVTSPFSDLAGVAPDLFVGAHPPSQRTRSNLGRPSSCAWPLGPRYVRSLETAFSSHWPTSMVRSQTRTAARLHETPERVHQRPGGRSHLRFLES